jgi:hypothetical protein
MRRELRGLASVRVCSWIEPRSISERTSTFTEREAGGEMKLLRKWRSERVRSWRGDRGGE